MDARTFDTFRPYVTRAIGDEEIRRNVTRAFDAARKVYDELSGEDAIGAASKLSKNDHVRDGLDTTVQSLSEAIVRMSGAKKERSGHSWTMVLLLIAGLVVLFNPATGAQTRRWVKDHLFGSEEEFNYATPKY